MLRIPPREGTAQIPSKMGLADKGTTLGQNFVLRVCVCVF